MKKSLPVYLAEACKNTFILVDGLSQVELDAATMDRIHQILVSENRDDAMILVNGTLVEDTFYCEMIVLGIDNTIGDFCGNGSRACAAYLYATYPQYQNFVLKTRKEGRPLLRYGDGIYSIHLPKVNVIPDLKFVSALDLFTEENGFYRYDWDHRAFYYADAIEPHLILVEDMDADTLHDLGQRLNQKKDCFPLGMNITVYHEISPNKLQGMTYERGVQRPTASCGTGATSAAAYYLKGELGSVIINNPGGTLTLVNHQHSIELVGPAEVTGFLTQISGD